jgi:hypothetical protein
MICQTIHHGPRKVIIVDWDDTILPSTFVDRWQIENSKDLPLHVSFPSCLLLEEGLNRLSQSAIRSVEQSVFNSLLLTSICSRFSFPIVVFPTSAVPEFAC